jgi:uncharacterized membrane protein
MMLSLILAVAYFIGIHVFISGTRLRGVIVARTGEQGFLGLFSLLSLVGMGWMIWAYSASNLIVVWHPLDLFRWLTLPLTLVAFLFVLVGLTTLSPTVTGGESTLDSPDAATGVLRITRHPFLWGVALWALTHLMVNGDAASMILFGGLLFLALIGPPLIDAKRKERFGDKWARFAGLTSNVPFLAIAQGRNQLRLGEVGWGRLAVGVIVWTAMIVAHPWLFGVSPLPF